MSGELAIILSAAAAGPSDAPLLAPPSLTDTLPATTAATAPLHALSLSIPSTDGWRGAQLGYERWFAAQRVAIGIDAGLRKSAEGDYTAVTTNVGIHVRRFWRADAWLSRLAAGAPVGWFYGGRVHVASAFIHDDVDDEWLGSTLQVGVAGELGYRIAPWRQLIVTPSVGVELHTDFDISGRLSPWKQLGYTAGLEVGWLF